MATPPGPGLSLTGEGLDLDSRLRGFDFRKFSNELAYESRLQRWWLNSPQAVVMGAVIRLFFS